MKNVFTSTLAISSLLLLAGCAHYKAKPLPRLATQQAAGKVVLTHKTFDKNDCKTYLGRKNILRKGYQPVHITINNPTNNTYTYSASSLSLPTVSAELVAKKVHFSTAGRAVGIGLAVAAGAIVTVTAIAGGGHALGCAYYWQYIFPSALLVSGVPFTAGAIAFGASSSKANKELSADFAAKSLTLEAIIRPSQTLNGIVFVPKKEFTNDFTVTLNNSLSGHPLVLHAQPLVVDAR